jgi:hypothetical protein
MTVKPKNKYLNYRLRKRLSGSDKICFTTNKVDIIEPIMETI